MELHTTLLLALGLLIPALLGIPMLALLGVRPAVDRIGYCAWSVLAGCLGLAAILRLGREVDWFFGSWLVPVVPLAVAALLAMFAWRRRVHASAAAALGGPSGGPLGGPSRGPFRSRPGYAIFVGLGVLVVVWFALAGLGRPCVEGDEGNIWSLQAKSLLVDWGDGFTAAQKYNLHPDYPRLNPWLQVWIYELSGGQPFVQFENRWLVQLCDVALFVALAAALRRQLPVWAAAPIATLLLLEPEFQSVCRTAYADGMVALGLVVALDGWLRFRAGDGRPMLALSGLGLAFALWSKNETMLYLASLVIAVGCAWLLRRAFGLRPALRSDLATDPASHRPADLLWLLPPGAVVLNTALWNRRFAMQSDLLGANPTGKSMFELLAEQWSDRALPVAAEAAATAVRFDHVHALFAFVGLAVVLVPRVALGRLVVPLLALLGSLLGLHVVYVGSFLDLRFHLDTSYLRVTFQLLPVALVLLAAIACAVARPSFNRQTAVSTTS